MDLLKSQEFLGLWVIEAELDAMRESYTMKQRAGVK